MDIIIERLAGEPLLDSIRDIDMVELHYFNHYRNGVLCGYLELTAGDETIRSTNLHPPLSQEQVYDFLKEEALQLRQFLKNVVDWEYHPDIHGVYLKGETKRERLFGSLLEDMDE